MNTEPLRFIENGGIDENTAARIVEAGVRVLKRVGLTVDGNDEFFDYLRAYGCGIDGKHVSFPDAVIDKVMARIAEGRKHSDGQPFMPTERITLYSSGQGSLWNAPEDDRPRSANRSDLGAYCRMLDALEMPRLHPGIIPEDVPRPTADLHAFATIALNSRAPSRVSPYSASILPYFIDIMTIVTGSREEAVNQAPFSCKLWINTPLMISREVIEMALLSRRLLRHKLAVTIMPVSGVSSPVSVAGAIVQEVAEVLASNTITLAIDDNLVGYCSSTMAFDMTSNHTCEAGPDSDIRRIAGAQVAKHWFGYPFIPSGIAPRTSASVPGVQSMMEKGIDMTLEVMRGTRDFASAGTLSQGDTLSAVQLLLDIELRDYLQRLISPIDVSDEALAEEIISEVAPQGARYLETEHTLLRYRQELWFPRLMDRRSIKAWPDNPVTMLDKARTRALELLANAPNQCSLDQSQRREIERICAAADRDLA